MGIPLLLGSEGMSQKLGSKRVLKLLYLFGLFFGCERRGALGLARSL